MLLQRHLRVAHPATVGTREGLRLLHRERLSAIVQVCRVGEEEAGLAATRAKLLVPSRSLDAGRGRQVEGVVTPPLFGSHSSNESEPFGPV